MNADVWTVLFKEFSEHLNLMTTKLSKVNRTYLREERLGGLRGDHVGYHIYILFVSTEIFIFETLF